MKVFIEREDGDEKATFPRAIRALLTSDGGPIKIYLVSNREHDWELVSAFNLTGLVRRTSSGYPLESTKKVD